MTTRPLILIPLLLLSLASARAEDAPPEIAVPAGMPVQLDGTLAPAEWSQAQALPIGAGRATLELMQFRGTLLIAFAAHDAWIEGDELLLTFVPDGAEKDLGAWTPGAVTIRYEPLKHDRSHLIVRRAETMSIVPYDDKVVARAQLAPHACSIELAVPIDFLGLEPGKEKALRFQCIRARPGARPPIPTWPMGLDVGARSGGHPADMQSSARWGRLTGLAQAGGPGALSKAAWKALLDEDQEITRRGRAAHMLMREMEEERDNFRKQDTLVEEEIFANLQWIAEREPLGDVDRLLMAKTYRFVNRHDEALAVLDALVTVRRRPTAQRAIYELALTYHDAERFAEEASAWERLAAGTPMAITKNQYLGRAQQARGVLERFTAEAAARREDALRRDDPLVEITTNRGTFIIQLFRHETPKAADHFVAMVKDGFYDGLRFHRALMAYIVQCGDPTTREGDCSLAGKVEGDRKVDVEQNKRRRPWRGAVCFARKQGLYSNGSHFFVMTGPRPDLVDDSKVPYTLFGWVVSGMEVVDRLEWCDTLERARVLVEPPPAAKGPPTKGDEPK